jgi:nitrate reductase assembly molybdenum cofactor insertion protein NarJ
VEELYTSTFELQSNCCLYAGHYIFGEDFRRSLLMVKLKEYFREIGFSAGKELPDHLCILLRFLARAGDSREAHDVLIECLVPAAGAILNQLPKSNPYHPVLESLLLVLKARWEEIVKRSEAPPHEKQEGAAENQQQPSAAEGES